jgi:hypothetical protein
MRVFRKRAQLNFSGPELIFAKFWEFLNKKSGSQVFKGWISKVRKGAKTGLGCGSPGRVREGDNKLVR